MEALKNSPVLFQYQDLSFGFVSFFSPWSIAFINDRLSGLEKNFLNPEGLPGRPLYWYVLYVITTYHPNKLHIK